MEAEMKLDAFISETLKQIVNGVKTAQAEVKNRDCGVSIVPPHMTFNHGGKVFDNKTGIPMSYVSFNVAVTTSDGANPKGDESVFVSEVKGNADPRVVNLLTTHVKFSVPILFPKDMSARY
jgi:hypothetical protein